MKMICKNCGEEYSEEMDFCIKCGCQFDNDESCETPMHISPSSKPSNKGFYLLGMLVSLIAIILSILLMTGTIRHTHSYVSSRTVETEYEYYGGDAYTGMQQASADASNNAAAAAKNISITNGAINNLSRNINTSVGLLILTIGGISFCYFLIGFRKED